MNSRDQDQLTMEQYRNHPRLLAAEAEGKDGVRIGQAWVLTRKGQAKLAKAQGLAQGGVVTGQGHALLQHDCVVPRKQADKMKASLPDGVVTLGQVIDQHGPALGLDMVLVRKNSGKL